MGELPVDCRLGLHLPTTYLQLLYTTPVLQGKHVCKYDSGHEALDRSMVLGLRRACRLRYAAPRVKDFDLDLALCRRPTHIPTFPAEATSDATNLSDTYALNARLAYETPHTAL